MALRHYVENFDGWHCPSNLLDDQWVDYDLTPHGIPPSALVEIAIGNPSNTEEYWAGVRKTGSSLNRRIQIAESEGAGEHLYTALVQADASGHIEYYSDYYFLNDFPSTMSPNFWIVGWWLGCEYVEKIESFTSTSPSSWEGYELNQYGVSGSQIADIVMTNDHDSAGLEIGVRTSGSALERKVRIKEAEGGGKVPLSMSVTTSGDTAAIDIYAENTSECLFYLLGYFTTPPGDYVENFILLDSPDPPDSNWQSLDIGSSGIPNNAVAQFAVGNIFNNDENKLGVRETSSTLIRVLDIDESETDGTTPGKNWGSMYARTDSNGHLEYMSEDVSDNPDFIIVGHWTNFTNSNTPFLNTSSINCFIAGRNPYAHYIEAFSDDVIPSTPIDQWNITDISSDIPLAAIVEGAIAEIMIRNQSNMYACFGGARSVDSTLDRKFEIHESEETNISIETVFLHVPVSNSGTIETYSSNASYLEFRVMGYWVGGEYIETTGSFNAGATSGWTQYNLNTYDIPGNKIVEILISNSGQTLAHSGGVRAVGSSLNRLVDIASLKDNYGSTWEGSTYITMFVKTSGTDSIIEVYAGDNNEIKFHVVGYWDIPPGDYTELSEVLTPHTSTTAWKDLDIASYGVPSGATAEIILGNTDWTDYNYLGIRESGSTLNRRDYWAETNEVGGEYLGVCGGRLHVNTISGSIQTFHSQINSQTYLATIGYWDNLRFIPISVSGSTNLFIGGIPNFLNTSGTLYTYGIQKSPPCDMYIDGYQLSDISGSLYIDGLKTINSGLTLFINGFGITPKSEQYDLFIHGQTFHAGSGDMFIDGHGFYSQSGNLFLKVPEPKTTSLNLIVYNPLDAGPSLIREENAIFYLDHYVDDEDITEYIQNVDWSVPGSYFYARPFIGDYWATETAGDGTLPFYNSLGNGFAANQFGVSFYFNIPQKQSVLGKVVDNTIFPYDQLADYPFAGSNSMTTAFWMSGSQVPASSQISLGGAIQTESGTRVHVGWFHRMGLTTPCHMLGLETRGVSGLIVRTSIRDVPYNQPSGGGLWWGGTTHYGTPTGSDWTWNSQVSGIYYSWEEEWPEIQLAREDTTFFVLHADFVPSGNNIPNHMKVYLSADGQPWVFIGSGFTGPPASSLYSYNDPHNRYAENSVGFHVVTNNWSGGYYGTNVGLSQIALWSDANKFTEDELYDLYHIVATYQRPLKEYRPTLDPPPTYITRTVGTFVYDPTILGVGYNPGEICSGLLITIEVGLGAYGEDASAYLLEETPPSGFYIRNISPEYTRYLHQDNRPNAGQGQLNDPQSGIMQPYSDLAGNIYGSKIRWVNHDNHPEHDQRRSVRPTKTYTYELYPFHYHGVPRVDEFAFFGSGVFFGGSTGSGVFGVEITGDISGTTSGLTGGIVNMGCNLYINGPEQTSGTTSLYIRTIESFTSSYIGNAPRTPEITDLIYAADGFAALESMAGIEYGPPLYIQGPLSYDNNCSLFIRGPEGREADLFVWGHQPFNNSGSHPSGVPMRIGDGHIVQSGSNDLVIRGPMPSSGMVGLYTMAGVFTSVGGGAGHGISLSLYTLAFEESSGNCSLFGKGPEFICTSGDFEYPLNSELFTYPSGGASPSLYTQGPEFVCSSGDFAYPGDSDIFTYPSGGLSPDLYILPRNNKNNWFALFIGPPLIRQIWTLYLKTADSDINDSFNLFIHGWQPASGSSGVNQKFSHMTLYLEAINADYPYTAGGTGNWTLFLQAQSGNLSSNDAWTLFLQADTTTSGLIGLYTYGHGIGESPHGIEFSGSVGLVCSVNPEDRWRIGYTPFDSDDDPWTLFLKGEPGHFGITTFYISGSVPTPLVSSGNLFVRGLFEQETNVISLYLMGVSGLFNNGPSGLYLFLDAGNQVYNISGNLYLKGY